MLLTLNFFNILRVIFAFLFQIFFIRFFGAGIETDVYYTAIGSLQFISLIIYSLLVDLYTPVFHRLNKEKPDSAKKLTNAVIILAFFLGLTFSLLCFFFPFIFSKVFAWGFSGETQELCSFFLRVWAITLLTQILCAVFIEHLNATMFMHFTYLTNLLIPAINLLALFIFGNDFGYLTIVYSYLIGNLLQFLVIALYFFKKNSFFWTNPFSNTDLFKLIKQNFPIYLGQCVLNLSSIINSNILSFFPSGYITIYKYIHTILAHITSIINSPIVRVLYSKTSSYLATKKINKLNQLIYSTIQSNSTFLTIALILNVLFFDEIYSFIFASKISSEQLKIMYYLFLINIPLKFMSSIETPFVRIVFALQKSFKILSIYIIYLLLYVLFISISLPFFGIYALPLSVMFAKISTVSNYMKVAHQHLDFSYFSILIPIFYLFMITVILVGCKHGLLFYFEYSILWGIALLVFFLVLTYKQIYSAVLFITGNHLGIK